LASNYYTGLKALSFYKDENLYIAALPKTDFGGRKHHLMQAFTQIGIWASNCPLME